MPQINPKLLSAIIAKTGLSKPAVYARIQQTASGEYLPRNLAAVKVGADVGLPINRYASPGELSELRQTGTPVVPPPIKVPDSRSIITESKKAARTGRIKKKAVQNQVFVVFGRDIEARDSVFEFLRSLGVKPIEWSTALAMSKKASPYIGEILTTVFTQARAVVVIMTPDDLAQLRPDLLMAADPPYEKRPMGQARANVLFECGMAFSSHPDQTVIVQLGNVRPFSDTYGRHILKLDNSFDKRNEFAIKLRNAGCDVDSTGTDWVKAGDFSDPETRKPKSKKINKRR